MNELEQANFHAELVRKNMAVQTPDADFVAQQMMGALGELNHYREATAVAEKQASEYRQKLKQYEDMMRDYERKIIGLQIQVKREADDRAAWAAIPLTVAGSNKSMMQVIEEEAMKKEKVNETLVERGEKYGPFIGHARVAQDLKHVIRDALFQREKELAEDQHEALEMICHKIARIINGDASYDDSWRDIAGYAMLVCNRLTGEGPK